MRVDSQYEYFENLDGLRFICFLSVFFFHSFHTEHQYIQESSVYEFLKLTLFRNGNMGVNFFFVLSGFLITFLLLEERENTGKINILNFWKRRILRIWPLFYACVVFGFLIFPSIKTFFHQIPTETAQPLYYIFFLNNFDFINRGLPDASVLGVLWSVAIEEQFYFVWPILLVVIPVRFYMHLILAIVAISLLFRTMYTGYDYREYHSLSCMNDIAVGAFGSLIIRIQEVKKQFENMSRNSCITLYCVLIVLFLFRHTIFSSNSIGSIVERLVLSIVFLGVILEQNYSVNSIFKMKNFKLISSLGVISYGLYCLHFIGILTATTLTKIFGFNTSLWQVLILETALALLITVILSKLSYSYLEGPFLRIRNRISITSKTGALKPTKK